mgnify:CR=1 FL=1
MKYLVCKKQHGDGCDYTIGCGMRFDVIEALSLEDAIEQTIYPSGRNNFSALEGEEALEELLIIPAEYATSVDLKSMTLEIESERKRQAEEQQRNKELAELERLKAKYGG